MIQNFMDRHFAAKEAVHQPRRGLSAVDWATANHQWTGSLTMLAIKRGRASLSLVILHRSNHLWQKCGELLEPMQALHIDAASEQEHGT